MGIFIWDTAPSKIFVGDTQVSKVFVWDTQVRPTWWGGWQPWANTLLYLPLNTTYTYTDQSGNQVSTTNTNVAFWTYQWVDCWTFSNNTRISVSPFNIPNDFTFVWRCYNTWVYQYEWQIFDARSGSSNSIRSFFRISNERYWYAGGFSVNNVKNIADTSWVNFIQNQWVLFVYTVTDWKQEIYVKWNNIDNYYSEAYQYSWFTPTYISIGQEWNDWARRHFIGGLSNIIIEDKIRTAQEIADYYDQTKWNYGY